jgi:hypothetical protein
MVTDEAVLDPARATAIEMVIDACYMTEISRLQVWHLVLVKEGRTEPEMSVVLALLLVIERQRHSRVLVIVWAHQLAVKTETRSEIDSVQVLAVVKIISWSTGIPWPPMATASYHGLPHCPRRLTLCMIFETCPAHLPPPAFPAASPPSSALALVCRPHISNVL